MSTGLFSVTTQTADEDHVMLGLDKGVVQPIIIL